MPFRKIAPIFSIVFGLIVLMAAPAHALQIDNLRFGVHPDKTRLALDLDELTDFRAFITDAPYRLVLDFPEFQWPTKMALNPVGSGIQNIRHGPLKPGITRIVMDLQGPAVINDAFIIPPRDGKAVRFVIDFKPASPAQAIAQKSKVFGTLDIQNARAAQPQTPTEMDTLVKQASFIAKQNALEVQAQSPAENTPELVAFKSPPIPQPKALAPSAPAPGPTPFIKQTIIIDPGHGGVDPGATGRLGSKRVQEKDVTLSMARELKKQLEATGRYNVVMTRNDDRFIKLRQRVAFAREHNGDLFISIHADSLPQSKARGASLYTLSDTASDKETAALARRENKADLIAGVDFGTEEVEVTNILLDLAMRDTMNQSRYFANALLGSMNAGGVKMLGNPHRYAGFAVLKAPDIPSILVEIGFMSNNDEIKLLTNPNHHRRIATSIVAGVDDYFNKLETAQPH